MGTLSVLHSCLVSLMICYFSTSVLVHGVPFSLRKSEDRFDVTISELHRMCEIKGLNLFESVLHFQIPYMNISMTATKKIFDSISAAKSVADLEILTEQHCRKNSDIRMYLQHFTDLVQTCMDETHRLGEDKKKRVLDMFLTRVCSDLQYDALEKYDSNCFKVELTKTVFSDCYGSPEPHGVVFKNDYMLPVQNHPTKKECTGIFKYYECVVFSVQHCEESTRKIVKTHFDEKKSFSGCGNLVNYF